MPSVWSFIVLSSKGELRIVRFLLLWVIITHTLCVGDSMRFKYSTGMTINTHDWTSDSMDDFVERERMTFVLVVKQSVPTCRATGDRDNIQSSVI